MRIADAMQEATTRLVVGSQSPRLDAEVLLAHVLEKDRSYLYARADDDLPAGQLQRFFALIARRATGIPAAYLTGHKEFWSLRLAVDERVLIPRPETERLVEIALSKFDPKAAIQVADLGTGSGAIALALAIERRHWTIAAVDNDPAALALAVSNAKGYQLDNVHFYLGDWCEPLPHRDYHLICANPPYIAADDPHLQTGIAYEPLRALVSAADGLFDLTRIIASAKAYLRPGGWLLLEHGATQAPALQEIFLREGYQGLDCIQDYAGLNRVSVGCVVG